MNTENLNDLIAQAVANEDQTDVTSGFTREIIPAGKTVARFLSYVEIGARPQTYQNTAKDDCEEVRITFELLSPKHINTVEKDGVTTQYASRFTVKLAKKMNVKAKFFKLFEKMRYGRPGITHMAQMLGEGFILELFHNEVGEGDKKKTFVNLNKPNSDYAVESPNLVDPISGDTTAVPVPPSLTDPFIFLWKNPTAESWGNLFIDGTYTKTVDGVETEVSKNWLQELILGANDYIGSPLEALIAGSDDIPDITIPDDLPDIEISDEDYEDPEESAVEKEPVQDKPTKTPKTTKGSKSTNPATKKTTKKEPDAPKENSAEAAMAALGLV